MNDFELEDMRQQMQTLKKKLEQQEIVNDRLMRRSMKKTVNKIARRYYAVMTLGLLMVPYGYWVFVVLSKFSVAFWIATSAFMLICATATYYNTRKISDPGLMNYSLLKTRKQVASAKKFDSDWLLFSIPLLILWLGWFCYEIYKFDHCLTNQPMFWGGCVGGIIGGIIGFSLHFKTQRQYQEIIDQIEDLSQTES